MLTYIYASLSKQNPFDLRSHSEEIKIVGIVFPA